MKLWKVILALLSLALLAIPATLAAEDVESSPDFSPAGKAGGLTGEHFSTAQEGRVLTINRETCLNTLRGDTDKVVTFTFPAFTGVITDIDAKFFATQEGLTLDCDLDAKQKCTNIEDMVQVTQSPRELTTAATSYKVEIDFDDLLQSVDPDKHNAVSVLTPEDCYPEELRGGGETGNNGTGGDAGTDAGTSDAGMDVGSDTGTTDTGTTDTGTTDTGTTDTGTTDTGTTDTGTTDTGTTDTGTTDTGTTDTGTTDTGTTDTGTDDGGSNGQIGFHNQYFVRLFVEGRVGQETQTQVSDVVFEIDAESAAPPEQVTDVAAFDEQITITWRQTRLQDVENHRAFVATKDFRSLSLREILADDEIENRSLGTGNKEPDDDGTFEESVDVDGLDLGEGDDVWVAVVSEDEVKNLSQPVFYDGAVTVVPVIDFWENYKEAGGDQSGCTTSEGRPIDMAVALLALVGLVAIRRRR